MVIQNLSEYLLLDEVTEGIFFCDDDKGRRLPAQEGDEAKKISVIPEIENLLRPLSLLLRRQDLDPSGSDEIEKRRRRPLRPQDGFAFWKIFDDQGLSQLFEVRSRKEMKGRDRLQKISQLG